MSHDFRNLQRYAQRKIRHPRAQRIRQRRQPRAGRGEYLRLQPRQPVRPRAPGLQRQGHRAAEDEELHRGAWLQPQPGHPLRQGEARRLAQPPLWYALHRRRPLHDLRRGRRARARFPPGHAARRRDSDLRAVFPGVQPLCQPDRREAARRSREHGGFPDQFRRLRGHARGKGAGRAHQHAQQSLRRGLFRRDPDPARRPAHAQGAGIRPRDLADLRRALPRDRL